ncbi:DUF1646 family protein [Bacillus fonticola]|uniref:DUF1646 family protein n=1 Tax=Bacillus fonticola TaxID=2728853 RepID=UPI001475554E|nr:DUF1646 family protein [Bacillus fonticola]
MVIGLLVIFLLVLFLPLLLSPVEKNLEMFLFGMGLFAAFISGVLNRSLFIEATFAPVNITVAVFVAGLLFKWLHKPLEKTIIGIRHHMPYRAFIALTVIFLGLISSVITAIISALVLVLIVGALRIDRKSEVRFVVLACFSIGLGAALSPIGEPLSTIAINKLDGGFYYLIELIGSEVFVALVVFGLMAAIMVSQPNKIQESISEKRTSEGYEEIVSRALKIYFFVMGLTFLGAGFEPLIRQYFLGLHPAILYWINIISAILDNATLTAAEISPEMDTFTIRAILLGLLLSGGMLIPGNIPNIIAASKLKITSKEWAKFGVPVGLVSMLVYFFAFFMFQ